MTGAPAIHLRRCARHPDREAAARCPSCGEFFCRECVVEHEGRILCAACLGRLEEKAARREGGRPAVARAATLVAGCLMLWLALFTLGRLLVKIPPRVADGSIWEDLEAK
ncbi:MAG TPA: hypothetical protein VGG37_01835 [Opitutaceae bacterium]|jgi:hypothetical protein